MSSEITFTEPFCCYCLSDQHFFRESLDETSAVVCPVLLNTTCKRCHVKGHTTARCLKTYEDDENCAYCHKNGHIKKNCPVLGTKKCTYCNEMGHVRNRCFVLMYKNKVSVV
jgi:hypothetical protein